MTPHSGAVAPAAGPGRPLRADARRNRLRILVAAEEVFAAKGSGAGVDDVAAAAGVGVGTLYRHFPTKEALLEAVLIDRMQRLVDDGRAQVGAAEPGPALLRFLEQFVAHSRSKQDMVDALGGNVDSVSMADNPDARCVFEQMTEVTGELLGAAQAAGAVRAGVSAADLIGLMLGPCMAPQNPLIGAACPERMLEVLWQGLRP